MAGVHLEWCGPWHRLPLSQSLLGCRSQVSPSPSPDRLTSYVFRVFALAHSTVTTQVLSLSSLCDMANWIITNRQAEDGHFLEEGPVVMTSMQVITPLPAWAIQTNPRDSVR